MSRCNCLCTKAATGTCALCEALAERDRFERLWFQKEIFRRVYHMSRQWLESIPHVAGRHPDVVREAHKQYSEALNKTMLTFIGVALFILLTTVVSTDESLLMTTNRIKLPLIDVPTPLFSVLFLFAPILLITLTIYLHILYGYWLDYERDRHDINQRLIPPIESIPTLFSFPDIVSCFLTWYVFYGLVPWVLLAITS